MSSKLFRTWIKSLGKKLMMNGSHRWAGLRAAVATNIATTKTRLGLETLETRIVPASITPSSAALPQNATALVVQGSGFDPNPANDIINFETGGVSGAVIAATATTLTVSLTISSTVTPTTAIYAYVFIASTDQYTQFNAEVAVVAPPGPWIAPSNTPLPVNATSITIAGSDFDPTAANDSVTFDNSVTGSVTSASTSALTVAVTGLSSLAVGTVLNASATVDGVSTGSLTPVGTASPGITPDSTTIPATSSTLTIKGFGFDSNTANDSVSFNDGVTGTVTSATTTSLVVSLTGLSYLPNNTALSATATVDTASTGSPVEVADVTGGVPVVNSSPSTLIPINSSVLTLSGSGFDSDTGNDAVTFDNSVTGSVISVTNTSLSQGTMTVSVTGLSSVPLGTVLDATVTVDGDSSSQTAIGTVVPTITANSTNLLSTSTSITINGYGFDSNTGFDTVTFSDSVTGTVTAANASTLTVSLTGLGSVNENTALTASVTVDGVSNGVAVEVANVILPAPTVTVSTQSLADSSATITINGTNFSNTGSQDSLDFSSGVTGSVTSASSTQLMVSITTPPNVLGELEVTVTVGGVSSASTQVATEVNGDFVVTDPGNGSGNFSDITLPYAVATALNGDTVSFAGSLSGDTIDLGSTLTINSSITITGLGANELAISGAGSYGVINVGASATAAIANLTIENGSGHSGGGIFNAGTLTLAGAVITGNSVAFHGNYSPPQGGGIYNSGTMTIYDSTINNNVAEESGGGIYNKGTMTVANSTIDDNGTENAGGNIYNDGNLDLTNSTITGNQGFPSPYRPGYVYGPDVGGNIYNHDYDHASLTLRNTIVSGGHTPYGGPPDIEGTVAFAYNSIIGNTEGTTVSAGTGNQLGVNPDLASSLAYNGGPTETVALQPGSPAVLAGTAITTVTSPVGMTDTTIYVQNAAAIAQTPGDYLITIGTEELLVTSVNVAQNTLTVECAQGGTNPGTYAVGTGVQFATDQRGSIVFSPSIGAYEPSNQVLIVTDAGSGPGSATDVTLPYAVGVADAQTGAFGDIIQFAASLSGDTIALTSTLTLTSTVTIEGLGATSLAVSGNKNGAPFSVFSLTSAANATIEGLTIENGLGILGGAFDNSGSLTLVDSVVSNNTAYGVGGGFFNTGELTLVNDTLSGNSAGGTDNGVFSTGPADLIITADVSAAVSTISDNIVLSGTPGVVLTGSGTITISGNINTGPNGSLNDAASGDVAIGGVISGTGGLTLSGSGTLTLFNTNTWTGATDIYNGTLVVNGNGETGAPSSAAGIFVYGGTLALSGGFDYTDAEPITITGSGTGGVGALENLSGDNTFSVPFTISGAATVGVTAGSLTFDENPLTLAGGTALTVVGSGTLNITNTITVTGTGTATLANDGTQTLTLSVPIDVTGAGTFDIGGSSAINIISDINLESQGNLGYSASANDTISGLISGTDASPTASINGLIMTGSGTLTLTEDNTYTGATWIDGGTLLVTQNGETGPTSAAGIFVDGGTLALSGGFDYTDAEAVTLSGSGANGVGALESLGGDNTFGVSITVSGPATIGVPADTLTLDEPLTLLGGSYLTVTGAGNVDITTAAEITVDAGATGLANSGTGLLDIAADIDLPYLSTLTLGGTGTIDISGNIALGALGSLSDTTSGTDSITGVISGTSTSPPVAADLPDVPGLEYDLDASNAGSVITNASGVSEWDDLSGYGNNFTAPANTSTDGPNTEPTLVQNAIGDLPALQFSGHSELTGAPNVNAETVFIVTNTLTGSYLGGIWGAAGVDESIRESPSAQYGYTAWRGRPGYGGNGNDFTFTDSQGETYISTANNQDQNTVNFGSFNTPYILAVTGDLTPLLTEIGGGSQGSRFYNGDIGQVLVYDTVLSTAQRQEVEQYLTGKWLTDTPAYVGEVTMAGTGALTLTNDNNSYTGSTVVDTGNLVVTTNGATGPTNAAGIYVYSGGSLGLAGGFTYTDGEAINLAGTGNNNNGAIENYSGNNTLAIPITLTSASAAIGSRSGTLTVIDTISGGPTATLLLDGAGTTDVTGSVNVGSAGLVLLATGDINISGPVNLGSQGGIYAELPGNASISGLITGTGTASEVVMAGSGTLTLSDTNDYTGMTTINNGTLVVTADGAMGPATAAGIFVTGGSLAFIGDVDYTTAEPLSIVGSGAAGLGAIESISGDNTFAGPITLLGNATIGADAGTLSLTTDAAIDITDGSLTTVGAGNIFIPSVIQATSPAAYVGFTGATGGVSSTQYVNNWTFDSPGTNIDYSSGFGSNNLVLNGGAYVSGTALELTDGGGGEARTAWTPAPVSITSFTTTFQFTYGANPGADGFTFAVQDSSSTAVGMGGGSLAYRGIPGISFAAEFNLYSGVSEFGLGLDGQIYDTNNNSPYVDLTQYGIDFHANPTDTYQATLTDDGDGNLTVSIWDLTQNDTSTPNFTGVFSVPPPSGLIVDGTGTVTLSNTNTYPGSTTINSGTLIVTADGAMGPAADPGIIVNSGGVLAFSGGVDYATAEPLTIAGAGPAGKGAIENISGTSTFAGAITLAADSTIGADAGTLNLTGTTINMNQGNLTTVGAGNINIAAQLDYVGAQPPLVQTGYVGFTGGDGGLTSQQEIDSWTYQSGSTTIDDSNGFASSNLQMNGNATLDGSALELTDGNGDEASSAFTPTVVADGAFTTTFTFAYPDYYPDADGFTFTVQEQGSTALGQAGGSLGYRGIPGTSISAQFNYYNSTYGYGGNFTFGIGIEGSINDNVVDLENYGLFPSNSTYGGDIFQCTLIDNGQGTMSVQITDLSSSAEYNGTFAIPATPVATGLNVDGTGTVTLSNANPGNVYYGPTNVNSGTLVLDSQLVSTSSVAVNSGATLAGTGSFTAAAVVTGGVVNPGSPVGSPGTLSVGSIDFSTNGNLTANITNTSSSLLSVTNSLTLGTTSTLTLNLAGLTSVPSGPITIITDGSQTGEFGALYVTNNPNDYQVTVAYTGGAVTVTFTQPTSPTMTLEADTGSNPSEEGADATFTVTVSSALPISGETVSIEDASNADAVVAMPTLINGTATFSISSLGVGSHNLFAVYTTDGTYGTSYSNLVTQVVLPPLAVDSVTATPSGFVLIFNDPIDPASTVLYSSPGDTTLGAADITVVGATTGALRGSLIIDPTDPDEATFVLTSGLLAPDTYTVTVTTAVSAIGGRNELSSNYSTTLTVATTTTPVLSVPSFARGPGQSVALIDTLGNDTGIPINISNASDVTQASFTLTYDPTLLTIALTGALSLSSAATTAGINTVSYSITSVDANHSVLIVTLTSSGSGTGLTTTTAETLVTILASVPTTAPYLDKEVLNLSSVQVNGANATGVSSVSVVAYPGDVLGTGLPNATDASLVDQVASGSGTGFSVFKDLDPVIIGGVEGGLLLNANDASLIDEAASGATVSQIPSIPVGVSLTFGGPDPYLYLSAVQGAPGQTVTETLYLDVTDPNGIQLTALDEAIGFNAGALQISDVRGTGALAALGSYDTASTVDNGSGEFLVGQAFMGTGLPPVLPFGTDVAVLQFDVTLNADMSVGSESGLTLLQVGTVNNVTQYTAISDNEGALTWTPGKAPSNRGNAAVDGSVTVVSATMPVVAEIVGSTSTSPVVVLPTVIEPVRRVTSVKAASPSVARAGATGTSVTTSSGLIVATIPPEELGVTSVGPLQLFPLATVQAELNPATSPAVDSAALVQEVAQPASLLPGVTRTADSGASLSVAALSTNKVGPVALPESSRVKSSTGVLDEVYRQLEMSLPAYSGFGYNLGAGDAEFSDDLGYVWDLENLLVDLD